MVDRIMIICCDEGNKKVAQSAIAFKFLDLFEKFRKLVPLSILRFGINFLSDTKSSAEPIQLNTPPGDLWLSGYRNRFFTRGGAQVIQQCRRDLPGEADHAAALEKERLVADVEATIEERQHQVPKAAPRSYRDFMVLAAVIVIVGLVLMVLLR